VGDVALDRAAHLVTVNGRPLRLARQELRLLELLMSNADRVLGHQFLLDSLWGPGYAGDPGTLAVHMLRLRKKLEREGGGTQHLRTVRGVGYIFDTVPI
jgi:DNA-binding response OmpR family regulator